MKSLIASLLVLVPAAAWPVTTEHFSIHDVLLPGPGRVNLDYFAWDPATKRLWIPAGNTGYVVVMSGATRKLTAINGFATLEVERGTRRIRMGPSSATVGEGFVYVGNRADSNICAIDAGTLEIASCVRIAPASASWAGTPDGIAYVASTKEVWITRGAPPKGVPSEDQALAILDASDPHALREKAKVPIGSSAEGYAVDETRGTFYTNVNETGETIAVDIRNRSISARWKPGCDDARGLALDSARGLLFNACAGRVIAMDLKQDGKVVGSVDTGEGLDNIDYSPSLHLLYAAASRAAILTIARVDDSGALTRFAVVPSVAGARGVVAGDGGIAYVADPANGRILVVVPVAQRTTPSQGSTITTSPAK